METNRTIPPQVEVRCIATDLHIECREQVEGRTITGYAAKFESWSEPIAGWFKEKIARSAFEGCNLQDVIMCFNHNVDDILARTTSGTLKLSVDDAGLRFEFDTPNTTRGNDMLELVRRGDVDKCSFKFIVEKDEWRYMDEKNKLEFDERTILKFALLKDVALVVFPAYKDTEASARHLEERKAEYMKEQQTQAEQSEESEQQPEIKQGQSSESKQQPTDTPTDEPIDNGSSSRQRLAQTLNIKDSQTK